ncbi:MAG: hypothetical protein ACUBOA_00090 [Candidatus Loosdrechtia sp.]|uniref:hypothetical protein n=1 Tax=Candidatus Loosdrechtia sp. TaxID=3101272 RepID=UPI003A73A076|nr:MAG: hypothetical protein QY305_03720 [Candidatus Jettenia sp. AMX2]
MKIVVAIFLILVCIPKIIYAHGECCLSKTISEATISGITLAPNFGISFQYEFTSMKTILDGDSKIGRNEVLTRELEKRPGTDRFSIPTRMTMQKYSLVGLYSVTERVQFLAAVPYVVNNMNMRSIRRNTMGMDMIMDMKMDTVEGLGDVTLMGLYTLYADKLTPPAKKLTLGLGVKTPTGKNDERTASGNLVHAMMQPGTGSWDPLFFVSYMRAYYPWVFQTNFLYQLSTEGDKGYEFGDKMSWDFITRYQIADFISPGIELNVFYSGKDTDHDGKYSRPDTSLIDNLDNTGLFSFSITPSVQIRIPNTGGNLDFRFQKPIYQNVRGIQQVTDWRAIAAVVWTF